MNWHKLLKALKSSVPSGSVTTYCNLSAYFFGHSKSGQAVRSMLQAAVNHDLKNAQYTNRVVHKNGKVADVNGQKEQLLSEGLPIVNSSIDLSKVKVVTF